MRGERSDGSSETVVRGRLLTMASTSQSSVLRLSSVIVCSRSTAVRTFRTVLICLSHMPPKWDALGGLKLLWMFLWRIASTRCASFQLSMHSVSSRSAPTRLVPRSDLMVLTFPRRATKRLRALMKESVERESAISRWMARFFF